MSSNDKTLRQETLKPADSVEGPGFRIYVTNEEITNITKLKPIYKNSKIYWILFVQMHIILIKIQEKFIHNF